MALGDSRRHELVAQYWKASQPLWSPLVREFSRAPQPLRGDAQDAARAAVTLAVELSNAYKRMLEAEAAKRIAFGGARLTASLVRRSLQAGSRVLTNSYLSYSPVPPQTWHDLHACPVCCAKAGTAPAWREAMSKNPPVNAIPAAQMPPMTL